MKTLLACCGLDGDPDALARLGAAVRDLRPDGVLFAGGLLRPGREADAGWDLTHEDASYLESLLHLLGRLGVFTALVHGPGDAPADEVLRLGMNAELEYPSLRVAHGTLCGEADLAVCGVGGRVSDGPACEVGTCSRTQAEYAARTLRSASAARKALLLACPEEEVCAALIARARPALCVVQGERGRWGSRRVGGALVVCPGHLSDGRATWVTWDRVGEPEARHLDLDHPRDEQDAITQTLRHDAAHAALADPRQRRAAGLVEKP